MTDTKYKIIVSDKAKQMLGMHIRFIAQVNKEAAKKKKKELIEQCVLWNICHISFLSSKNLIFHRINIIRCM